MQVSLELIHIIRANGGTVLNRKEVTRILVKDEAIQGVEVNHEEILESTYVISNLHPQLTLSLLDKNHSIKPAFVSRINLKFQFVFVTHFLDGGGEEKRRSCADDGIACPPSETEYQ